MTNLATTHTAVTTEQPNGSLQDLLKRAQEQYDLAFKAHKRVGEHVWKMGTFLIEAKAKYTLLKKQLGKAQPNWETTLKEFGISISSDHRARQVANKFNSIDDILGLTITEAYDLSGVSRGLPDNRSPDTSTSKCKSDKHAQAESRSPEHLTVPLNRKVDVAVIQFPVGLGNVDDKQTVDDDESDEDFDDFDDNVSIDDGTYESERLLKNLQTINDILSPLRDEQPTVLLDKDIDGALKLVEQVANLAIEIKMELEQRLAAKA